jgi:hypothetical protein
MIWQELVKTAFLGTDRKSLPQPVIEYLQSKGISFEDGEALAVAQSLGYLVYFKKAGFPLADFKGQLPEIPISDSDRSTCSHHLIALLYSILKSEKFTERWFPEIIRLTDSHKKFFPNELLPDYFKNSKNALEFLRRLQKINFVLHPLSKWLIGNHPDWRKWTGAVSEQEWRELPDKLDKFCALRFWNPEAAINFFRIGWEKDDWSSKVAKINACEIGLNEGDEDFLASCHGDKSPQVKKAALRLLLRLPHSGEADKWMAEAISCVTMSGNRFLFKFPGYASKLMAKDALLPSPAQSSPRGNAVLLWNWFSTIEPGVWCKTFKKKASELIEIIDSSSHKDILLEALAVSTSLHKNKDWADILFNSYCNKSDSTVWNAPTFVRECTPGTISDTILHYLRNQPLELPNDRVCLVFTQEFLALWKDELAREVANRIRRLSEKHAHIGNRDLLLRWCKALGFGCSSHLIEEIAGVIGSAMMQPEVQLLQNVLRQRKSLHEIINN